MENDVDPGSAVEEVRYRGFDVDSCESDYEEDRDENATTEKKSSELSPSFLQQQIHRRATIQRNARKQCGRTQLQLIQGSQIYQMR